MAVARRLPVDTPSTASISFRPPESSVAPGRGQLEGRLTGGLHDLGRSQSSGANRSLGRLVHGFPIQQARVQRPPLRPTTLHRERLVSWLDEHVRHRLIFVTAEAGYGKT